MATHEYTTTSLCILQTAVKRRKQHCIFPSLAFKTNVHVSNFETPEDDCANTTFVNRCRQFLVAALRSIQYEVSLICQTFSLLASLFFSWKITDKHLQINPLMTVRPRFDNGLKNTSTQGMDWPWLSKFLSLCIPLRELSHLKVQTKI